MPVTVIAEWTRGGDDTTIHDEVHRRLGIADDPPAGLIIHTSGATEAGGFRICDVWETRDAWEAFRDDRLGRRWMRSSPGCRTAGPASPNPPP